MKFEKGMFPYYQGIIPDAEEYCEDLIPHWLQDVPVEDEAFAEVRGFHVQQSDPNNAPAEDFHSGEEGNEGFYDAEEPAEATTPIPSAQAAQAGEARQDVDAAPPSQSGLLQMLDRSRALHMHPSAPPRGLQQRSATPEPRNRAPQPTAAEQALRNISVQQAFGQTFGRAVGNVVGELGARASEYIPGADVVGQAVGERVAERIQEHFSGGAVAPNGTPAENFLGLVTKNIDPSDPLYSCPQALEAAEKEMIGLTEGGVWDLDSVEEWNSVRARVPEAELVGAKLLIGIKDYELLNQSIADLEWALWKARFVCTGNFITNARGKIVWSVENFYAAPVDMANARLVSCLEP